MTLAEDQEFIDAQERLRKAKAELKAAEDAVWLLLASHHPDEPGV